jgi:ABC-type multidrug transport system fused ATPase/permease subunit
MGDLVRRVWRLLTPRQRRRALWLQAYFVLAGLVQMLGVASIAPFIALLANPGLITTHPLLQPVYAWTGAPSPVAFLVGVAAALMGVIVVSNAIFALSTWFTMTFALRLTLELERDVLRGYLHRDFAEVARTDSAQLASVFTNDLPRFNYMVLQSMLAFVSQALVVVCVSAGLVAYSPTVALVAVLLIGGGYLAVFAVVKRRLAVHGAQVVAAGARRFRLFQESLGGLKAIRLAGLQPVYEARVGTSSRETLHSHVMLGVLAELPRFLLESLAFCALLAFGAVLLLAGEAPQVVVTTLSVYAMAGYRLLPAAQNLFRSAAAVRGNAEVLPQLEADVQRGRAVAPPDKAPVEPFPDAPIVLEGVGYQYPGTPAPVLHAVSAHIPRHAITVLVGASGAGKSTLADLLLGLLRPDTGRICIGDRPLADAITGWQRQIGYVPQELFLLDDSIAANIAFGDSAGVDRARVLRAAQQADLGPLVEALPEGMDYGVGERGALLSGGQRQRLGIARALYREPAVLVLDEATSALDPQSEREVLATLASLKATTTIVMIAHRPAAIRAADAVLWLDGGRLMAAGPLAEVEAAYPAFRALLAGAQREG